MLGGDPNALEQMRADLADLREQKEILLKAKGYPPDYMEMKYRCPDCRDTGYVNGKKVPLLPEGADAPALCPVQY